MIPTVSTLVKYDAAQSVRAPIEAANPLPALARSCRCRIATPPSGPRAPSRHAIDR